jgi:hypothetical protein
MNDNHEAYGPGTYARLFPADEEYEFDRLRNGVLMAEGVRVHAPTLNEAICKAKGLFHPWDQRDTLQLRKDV